MSQLVLRWYLCGVPPQKLSFGCRFLLLVSLLTSRFSFVVAVIIVLMVAILVKQKSDLMSSKWHKLAPILTCLSLCVCVHVLVTIPKTIRKLLTLFISKEILVAWFRRQTSQQSVIQPVPCSCSSWLHIHTHTYIWRGYPHGRMLLVCQQVVRNLFMLIYWQQIFIRCCSASLLML